MTKQETALDNYINERGWNDASNERISGLLNRLNGRMATIAIADTDIDL